MKQRPDYHFAPRWVEQRLPESLLPTSHSNSPHMLLIDIGDDTYRYATSEEVDAIADPKSFAGGLLRSHSNLMALTELSNN